MDNLDNSIKKAEDIKFLQNKIKTSQTEIIDYGNKLLPMQYDYLQEMAEARRGGASYYPQNNIIL
jgi:hypothetical protein